VDVIIFPFPFSLLGEVSLPLSKLLPEHCVEGSLKFPVVQLALQLQVLKLPALLEISDGSGNGPRILCGLLAGLIENLFGRQFGLRSGCSRHLGCVLSEGFASMKFSKRGEPGFLPSLHPPPSICYHIPQKVSTTFFPESEKTSEIFQSLWKGLESSYRNEGLWKPNPIGIIP
jgi:hypothetical protein